MTICRRCPGKALLDQRREAEERAAQKMGGELRRAQMALFAERRENLQSRLAMVETAVSGTPVSDVGTPLLPILSIGRPEIWRPSDILLERMPPRVHAQLQTADFYVIRLFCSFRPVPGRARVGWARFHVFLLPDNHGRQPIAYDISPVEITQEVKRHLKVTLAPTLKFQAVEAGVGSLEFGLEYPELQPIIVGAGIGEATPTWDYRVTTGVTGIQGVKWMDLVVKAPKGMPAARAQLALTAQVYVETRWIPVMGGPAEQGARMEVPLWHASSLP